jgi:hypothetical protein
MNDSEDENIARSIQKHGWHAISVMDRPPGFVYTCGLLTTFDHPELIVFGLKERAMYDILAAMVEDLRKQFRSFSKPGIYDGVLDGGFTVATRPVLEEHHEAYLGYAMGHCRVMGKTGSMRAIQVFWPDSQRRFPFDVACDLRVVQLQPRLDRS